MERGPLQDVVRPSVLIAIISVSDVGQPVATVANPFALLMVVEAVLGHTFEEFQTGF